MASRLLILAVAPFSEAALLVGPLAARRALIAGDHVTLVTSPAAADLVRALGLADEVWETGEEGKRPHSAREAVSAASLLVRTKRRRFDAVVDIAPKPMSMIASLLATGGRSVTSARRYSDVILGSRAKASGPDDPVERIAGLIGVATVAASPEVALDPESNEWVERALAAIGYDSGPVVAVQTSGLWPPDRFVDVAARLRSGFGAWVVTLDAPRTAQGAREMADALGGHVLGVASPTGARFVAVLARASLVVTDDPATAAMATFLGAPSVLVAGSGGMLPTLHDRIVLASSEARSIDPDAVFEAAAKLVGKPRTSSLFRS